MKTPYFNKVKYFLVTSKTYSNKCIYMQVQKRKFHFKKEQIYSIRIYHSGFLKNIDW